MSASQWVSDAERIAKEAAATARETALEEAAKVADSYVVKGTNRDMWTNGNAHGIAADIRALKARKP